MWIDSHCHLDDPRFQDHLPEVLARAASVGIEQIVVPGVSLSRWSLQDQLPTERVVVRHAYGIHPWYIQHHQLGDLQHLEQRLADTAAVAVGEIGLDFFPGQADEVLQRKFFHGQLELAVQFGLPVILHARKSYDQILKALKQHSGVRGVFHGFTGSAQQARHIVEAGFYLGLGGAITHAAASRLRQTVADLPMSSLLLETDAPDQAPAGHQQQLNEPCNLVHIGQELARLTGLSVEEIARQSRHNAKSLFAI